MTKNSGKDDYKELLKMLIEAAGINKLFTKYPKMKEIWYKSLS